MENEKELGNIVLHKKIWFGMLNLNFLLSIKIT